MFKKKIESSKKMASVFLVLKPRLNRVETFAAHNLQLESQSSKLNGRIVFRVKSLYAVLDATSTQGYTEVSSTTSTSCKLKSLSWMIGLVSSDLGILSWMKIQFHRECRQEWTVQLYSPYMELIEKIAVSR